MSLEKLLYTAHASAKGGREGQAKTDDGKIDLKFDKPVEMGGRGNGTNPEQLFAMGYSACFLGAMHFVAAQDKVRLSPETTINGSVGIGTIPTGFSIEVELKIHVPDMEKADAEALVQKAHGVCPYSNATRGNIDVKLTVE